MIGHLQILTEMLNFVDLITKPNPSLLQLADDISLVEEEEAL
jgi:hypothetical protein